MNINFNLEEEFLKFSDNLKVFPEKKDYTSIYKVFNQKFNTLIHPEIKTKILEIEKEGYYNDHGVDHIKMVIERTSWILSCISTTLEEQENHFYLSPYETFILLMAIHLHDTGHLITSRKEHAKAGKQILAKFDQDDLLSISEKRIIGDIAKAHGGKNDPIGKLEPETRISHHKIRPQLLASLLRLGDELAEDKTRASGFLQKIGHIEKTSEIYHLYSASLDSLDLSNNEISLEFCFLDEISLKKYPKASKDTGSDVFLLDEIYERTLKTFTEALYCNRFFTQQLRFSKVKVNILILNSENHENIHTIKYELKELLYPTVVMNSIYDICNTLMENGEKQDGEYIAKLIKEKSTQDAQSI